MFFSPASEASGGSPPLSRSLYYGGAKHFSANRCVLESEEEKKLWSYASIFTEFYAKFGVIPQVLSARKIL